MSRQENNVHEKKFINPYNFIPLFNADPERKSMRDREQMQDQEQTEQSENKKSRQVPEKWTGKIRYSLSTRSPLFIPNTSNPNIFGMTGTDSNGQPCEHKSYEFFSYDDLLKQNSYEWGNECNTESVCNFSPIIPGSEIRGMLRSNFEILTNSCLSSVDDSNVLSKRTNEAFKAGLIKKTENGYELYEAEDCLLRTGGENNENIDSSNGWKGNSSYWKRKCYVQENLREGQKVCVTIRRRGRAKPLITKIRQGDKDGYIVKGEPGPDMDGKQNKHCCHVFVKKEDQIRNFNINDSIQTLSIVLDEYEKSSQDKQRPRYQEYKQEYYHFLNGETGALFPVYYSMIPAFSGRSGENYCLFSPACITREVYQKKLKDFLGKHKPCSDLASLCPSCRLFGTIGVHDGKKFSVSSKIRFSDLRQTGFWNIATGNGEGETDNNSIYEKPLTLPPLSSPKLNNMEFYLKKPENAWFWTYDYYIDYNGNIKPNHCGINGRKFYWHKLGQNVQKAEPNAMNMSIRPVRGAEDKGVVFQGEVYFEKISKKELDQLLYLLETGEPGEMEHKRHGYKLGAAKPLGFGSVAIQIDEVKVLQYQLDTEQGRITRQWTEYPGYADNAFIQDAGIPKEIQQDFAIMTQFDILEQDGRQGIPMEYPGVKEKTDIFEWFTWNHAGYKKKNGKIEQNGMPNSRKQMVFRKHMESLKPELVETDTKLTGVLNGAAQFSVYNRRQAGSDHTLQASTPSNIRIGCQKAGTVIGYENNGAKAVVSFDQGEQEY